MINIDATIYYISKKMDVPLQHSSFSNLSGGSINNTFKITVNDTYYVLKVNSYENYPLLKSEAEGLEELQKTHCVRVPSVVLYEQVNMAYHVGEEEMRQKLSFLLLEHIEHGKENAKFWQLLAEQLACLHTKINSHFGFSSHNYIGTIEQRNEPHEKWADFFREERIMPLARKAFDRGLLSLSLLHKIENFTKKFEEIFPEEAPALIHGDLWHGNVFPDVNSVPVLIDPAVHYGHREAEIAFTYMFGKFDDTFYNKYNEIFPLQEGFEDRINYYNVYHALTHLLMFGKAYLAHINNTLYKF